MFLTCLSASNTPVELLPYPHNRAHSRPTDSGYLSEVLGICTIYENSKCCSHAQQTSVSTAVVTPNKVLFFQHTFFLLPHFCLCSFPLLFLIDTYRFLLSFISLPPTLKSLEKMNCSLLSPQSLHLSICRS